MERLKWRSFSIVRLAAHVSNGWKSRIRPSSGKDIAEHQGCPSWGGIWRKVEANLWSDEQKSHQATVKDKIAIQIEVQ